MKVPLSCSVALLASSSIYSTLASDYSNDSIGPLFSKLGVCDGECQEEVTNRFGYTQIEADGILSVSLDCASMVAKGAMKLLDFTIGGETYMARRRIYQHLPQLSDRHAWAGDIITSSTKDNKYDSVSIVWDDVCDPRAFRMELSSTSVPGGVVSVPCSAYTAAKLSSPAHCTLLVPIMDTHVNIHDMHVHKSGVHEETDEYDIELLRLLDSGDGDAMDTFNSHGGQVFGSGSVRMPSGSILDTGAQIRVIFLYTADILSQWTWHELRSQAAAASISASAGASRVRQSSRVDIIATLPVRYSENDKEMQSIVIDMGEGMVDNISHLQEVHRADLVILMTTGIGGACISTANPYPNPSGRFAVRGGGYCAERVLESALIGQSVHASANRRSTQEISNTCLPQFAQCGGTGWTGSTCCTDGLTCAVVSEWHSQCVTQQTEAGLDCNGPQEQCGGQSWTLRRCCPVGYQCTYISEDFSVCLSSGNEYEGNYQTSAPQLTPPTRAPVITPAPTQIVTTSAPTVASPTCITTGQTCDPGTEAVSSCCNGLSCVSNENATIGVCLILGGSTTPAPSSTTTTGHLAWSSGNYFGSFSSSSTDQTSPPTSGCNPWGALCAGVLWSGPDCCEPGSVCTTQGPLFSKCLAPENTTDGPTLAPLCAAPGSKCGGLWWKGATCCQDGARCVKKNDDFSVCVRAQTRAPVGTAPPLGSTTIPITLPGVECSELYSPCGGLNWSGPTCCKGNAVCVYDSQWVSECRPNGQVTDVPVSSCGNAWDQCGGQNFNGISCCKEGLQCHYRTDLYYECVSTASIEAGNQQQPCTTYADGQCGGLNYVGPTCCPSGTACEALSTLVSRCTPQPPTPAPTNAPTDAGTVCAKETEQCGGLGWAGAQCCEAGNVCTSISMWNSQCVHVAAPAICSEPWTQCGGTDYTGPQRCCQGSSCVKRTTKYSQCVPN